MTSRSVQDRPSTVSTEDNEVIQEGGAGLAVSYTPDAAEITGERLKKQAGKARENTDAKNNR